MINEEKFFELYIDNDYLDYLYQEIKRRNKVVLMTYGEKGYLFKKRWSGVVCTHPRIQEGNTDVSPDNDFFDPDLNDEVKEDSDLEIIHRCPDCFGTGYFGGYFLKQEFWFRYGDMPSKEITRTDYGIELDEAFNSWTLDEPVVHEKDFILRQNGERYRVTDVSKSEWRGRPLHQVLNLEKANEKDIIFDVNDKTIKEALNNTEGEPEDWSDIEEERL